ncbi:hypothetical protein AOQ84DRAFT_143720 [Glonium stellatum]|uniref:Ryanodine receptor Ryr domain-containing protein n=1 Tax=Glonium stellatum TaxID=574774 RepID=A0A8E2JNH6_9PEZI|nr:hypothetical protein AOQ84DRAFT_143720 [Glonium stellatum]
MPPRHILIAGDASHDLFLYPLPASLDSGGSSQRPRTHWFRGGVGLLAHLLNGSEQSGPRVDIYQPNLAGSENPTIHPPIQSVIELKLHTPNSQDPPTYSLKRKQRLNVEHRWHAPEIPSSSSDNGALSLCIFQDAEGFFNDGDSEIAITRFNQTRPRFLLYHMARPLCSGKIWEAVRRGPFVRADKQDPQRVIVVVSADDLRAEGIELSYGLSWERTCEDFVEQLGSTGKLVTLVTCAHLIVLFGCDGVIYHRGLQVARPMLFFDPLRAEGEFARENLGPVPGVAEAFVAGFAKAFMQSEDFNFEDSIESGFWAARRLARHGLSMQSPDSSCPLVYDASKIMGNLNRVKKGKLVRFSIPSDDIGQGNERNWSLLDHTIGDSADVARRIVKEGPHSSANLVPSARFNNLVLFDRHEIESFRTLFNSLAEYLAVPESRPLSIALFGPRNSGKSFAALQVAETASKGHKVRQLRYDLSQFTQLDDLLSAFHSVRDCTLEGFTPLVYFNGFDSDFAGSQSGAGSQFGWLPYLLAPMLLGKFSDGGVSRPIGPAVFFFGATRIKTYEKLKLRADADTGNITRARDFLGCLHGFVDMPGPDRVDHGNGVDRLYPVRRAVVLRALLEAREPNLKSGDQMNIDESVLNGLLLTPYYRQGIRSLRSIIAMSRLNNRRHFERAALPPQAQLDLHVDYNTFMKYMRGLPIPDRIREELAEKLHNVYYNHRAKYASPEEIKRLKRWNELDEELRESSRAHADSIPQKLRLVQCFLAEKQEYREPIKQFTIDQVELLAENEHERWNAERLQKQWSLGERAPEKRSSPFLIPWEDLDPEYQEIDRIMVRAYPTILPEPYYIYKMGPKEISPKGVS